MLAEVERRRPGDPSGVSSFMVLAGVALGEAPETVGDSSCASGCRCGGSPMRHDRLLGVIFAVTNK